ncbi:MAG: hypothetical protein ACE5R6_05185 [Candidatus Heimdallarchaeota archaeon]
MMFTQNQDQPEKISEGVDFLEWNPVSKLLSCPSLRWEKSPEWEKDPDIAFKTFFLGPIGETLERTEIGIPQFRFGLKIIPAPSVIAKISYHKNIYSPTSRYIFKTRDPLRRFRFEFPTPSSTRAFTRIEVSRNLFDIIATENIAIGTILRFLGKAFFWDGEVLKKRFRQVGLQLVSGVCGGRLLQKQHIENQRGSSSVIDIQMLPSVSELTGYLTRISSQYQLIVNHNRPEQTLLLNEFFFADAMLLLLRDVEFNQVVESKNENKLSKDFFLSFDDIVSVSERTTIFITTLSGIFVLHDKKFKTLTQHTPPTEDLLVKTNEPLTLYDAPFSLKEDKKWYSYSGIRVIATDEFELQEINKIVQDFIEFDQQKTKPSLKSLPPSIRTEFTVSCRLLKDLGAPTGGVFLIHTQIPHMNRLSQLNIFRYHPTQNQKVEHIVGTSAEVSILLLKRPGILSKLD